MVGDSQIVPTVERQKFEEQAMKIVIAGGTGFIGRHLCHHLVEQQHEVTVLSRNPSKAKDRFPPDVTLTMLDALSWRSIEQCVNGAHVVINLMGEPIADARWTEARKTLLRQSRIDTTRMMVNAFAMIPSPPKLLINASGIGYYGIHPPGPVDEFARPGNGFLAELCVDWETEALKANAHGVRVVCLRTGMVLGKGGGALAKMLPPFQMFVGGPIRPGTQPVSWIHIDDLAQLIIQVMNHTDCQGPINAVSPHPVTMQEFCDTLGKVLGRPSWLPVPSWILKLALGEMATMLTHGQSIKPTVAHKIGMDYKFPFLEMALESIIGRP